MTKSIEIVILSYNRLESLILQLNRLIEFGYINNSRISVVIQDNNSDDGTKEVLIDFEKNGFLVRRSINNIGYGSSYIKAHKLCEYDYLWVLGDDLPLIHAEYLLSIVDDFTDDMVYAIFKSSPEGMPPIQSKYFGDNKAYANFSINNLVEIDSNAISLLGGFVSGIIWSRNIVQNTVSRYTPILLNTTFTSNSPQVLIILLLKLELNYSQDTHAFYVRVYKESFLAGVACVPAYVTVKHSLGCKIKKRTINLLNFKRFVTEFGYGLFVPAVIWIRMSYIMGALYAAPGSIHRICQSHLDPMAFHFSVFYRTSNAKPALYLLLATLNRLIVLNYKSIEYTRHDCMILIYRLIRCQFRGLEIKRLYW